MKTTFTQPTLQELCNCTVVSHTKPAEILQHWGGGQHRICSFINVQIHFSHAELNNSMYGK